MGTAPPAAPQNLPWPSSCKLGPVRGEYQLKILVFLGIEERNTQSQTHRRKTPATQAPPTHRPRGQQAANKRRKRATARAAPQPPGTTAGQRPSPWAGPAGPHTHPGHHQVGAVWEAARARPSPRGGSRWAPPTRPTRLSSHGGRSRLRGSAAPRGSGWGRHSPRGRPGPTGAPEAGGSRAD